MKLGIAITDVHNAEPFQLAVEFGQNFSKPAEHVSDRDRFRNKFRRPRCVAQGVIIAGL